MVKAFDVLLKLLCVLKAGAENLKTELVFVRANCEDIDRIFLSVGLTVSFLHSPDLPESRTSCSGLTALETVPNHFTFQEFSVFRKKMLITYFLSGCKVLETMPGIFYANSLLLPLDCCLMG